MAVLLDTNILIRLLEPSDRAYLPIRRALRTLRDRGEDLCYASQNMVEFWATCTRPAERNGIGLNPIQTHERASIIEAQFRLLPETTLLHSTWRSFVVKHSVSGVQVYDARIAAVMTVHGVRTILTLNGRDFARYTELIVISPDDAAPSTGAF